MSGRIQKYYAELSDKHYHHGIHLNSLSGYVLSLSGRIQKYYAELSDKHYYHGIYLELIEWLCFKFKW